MESFYTALKEVSNSISQIITSTISSYELSSSTSTRTPTPSPPSTTRKITTQNKNANANESAEKLNNLAIEIAVSIIQLGVISIGIWYWKKWLANTMGAGGMGPGGRGGDNPQARERLMKMLLEREVAKLVAEHEEENENESNNNGKKQLLNVEAIREKVRRQVVRTLDLNQYETAIAEDVIDPADIQTTFQDVGGIDHIKTEIWDLVVLPILRPDLFVSSSGLVSPPRGILLYGAPGTGKTMLAKAIAKESGASFVNVRLSSIMDKWFGESNKLVSATFSLARKLAPSVIFIDEIDTFLNQRDSGEGAATTSMKSEFLTLWDGMLSDTGDNTAITVLGATNRPYDVDSAILRRLPRTFMIGLPVCSSRIQILELFLKKQSLTEGARKMIPKLAEATEGYSGSDLKELCRAAAMAPVREITSAMSQRAVKEKLEGNEKEKQGGKKLLNRIPVGTKMRPVNEDDFKNALKKVKRTGQAAHDFRRSESSSGNLGHNDTMNDMARAMQMMNTLLSSSNNGTDNNAESKDDNDIPNLN